MYLARAQASKRALAGAARECPAAAASRSISKLHPARGTGRLSSSLVGQAGAAPTRARVALGVLPTARGPTKGGIEARSAKLMARDQHIRSLGSFSGAGVGSVSDKRLRELEKMAAQAPSDANAEVRYVSRLSWRRTRCDVCCRCVVRTYVHIMVVKKLNWIVVNVCCKCCVCDSLPSACLHILYIWSHLVLYTTTAVADVNNCSTETKLVCSSVRPSNVR